MRRAPTTGCVRAAVTDRAVVLSSPFLSFPSLITSTSPLPSLARAVYEFPSALSDSTAATLHTSLSSGTQTRRPLCRCPRGLYVHGHGVHGQIDGIRDKTRVDFGGESISVSVRQTTKRVAVFQERGPLYHDEGGGGGDLITFGSGGTEGKTSFSTIDIFFPAADN